MSAKYFKGRETDFAGSADQDVYLASNEEGRGAVLQVTPSKELPNFSADPDVPKYRVTSDFFYNNYGSSADPDELFSRKPAQINFAMSNREMRHVIPTLGALVLKDHPDAVTSGDLSAHSRRLVDRLSERGVLHASGPHVSNRIDFMSSNVGHTYRPDRVDQIPEKDVQNARNDVRALLGKPRKLSAQFDALQKFEEAHEARVSGKAPYNPDTDPNAVKLPGMD